MMKSAVVKVVNSKENTMKGVNRVLFFAGLIATIAITSIAMTAILTVASF